MLYRTIEIDELIEDKESEREVVKLMENATSHLNLVWLKKHSTIEPHMSHSNTSVFLIEGELEFVFNQDSNCACNACGCDLTTGDDDKKERTYRLKKGQMFFFAKDDVHSVKALKDSKFLLIKI